MKCLDKIITKMKSLFKRKGKEKPVKASPETLAFIEENKEVIEYIVANKDAFVDIVKYQDVYMALINSISAKEIAILNKEFPCKFREGGSEPFKANCACKVDGEANKSIAQCESCKYRTE